MQTVKTSERNQTAIDPILQSAKNASLRNIQAVEKGAFKAGFSIVNPTDKELNNIAERVESGATRYLYVLAAVQAVDLG